MRRSTVVWLLVIVATLAVSLYMVWPDNPGFFGRPIQVRPGLDIQGGLRVLMQAEGSAVTAEQMSEVRRVIDRRVNALGVAEPVVQQAGSNRIIVELPGIDNPDTAISIIQQTALLEFVNFSRVGGCTAAMPVAGQYIRTNVQADRLSAAPQQGTAQPTAQATAGATGEPTTEPTSAATAAANATAEATSAATAEVTAEVTAAATQAATVEAAPATAEATSEATAAAEPTAEPTAQATEAAAAEPGTRNSPLNNPCTGQPFETVMTGAGLRDATARIGAQGQSQYVVAFNLNAGSEDATAFTNFTASNIGQPLAIVLDGEVLSAPTVQNRIEGSGEITGGFTQDEARNLALQLRSGALPVSLNIQSIERVGASLGAESVALSVRAGVLGVLTIFFFLLVYYRVGGLAASLALLVFTAINFALYKFIPVTLTLSAITGFLISIGSAIDGNILIFERIKEELRNGKGLSKSMELGFSRAWRTIRDSNISTILIGLILYFFGGQFGASAVRGFAVTLIIGLALNLFTTVIVTRAFLELILWLLGDRAQKLNLFGQKAQ